MPSKSSRKLSFTADFTVIYSFLISETARIFLGFDEIDLEIVDTMSAICMNYVTRES